MIWVIDPDDPVGLLQQGEVDWEALSSCLLTTCPVYSIGTGCSGKIVFFHNSMQTLPRLHRCKRPSKLSTQRDCTTVTPIGW